MSFLDAWISRQLKSSILIHPIIIFLRFQPPYFLSSKLVNYLRTFISSHFILTLHNSAFPYHSKERNYNWQGRSPFKWIFLLSWPVVGDRSPNSVIWYQSPVPHLEPCNQILQPHSWTHVPWLSFQDILSELSTVWAEHWVSMSILIHSFNLSMNLSIKLTSRSL